MKRRLILAVASLLIATTGCLKKTDPVAPRARGVVYHISDSDRAIQAIRHIRFQREADLDIQISVVALSGGIDFLIDGARDEHGNTYASLIDGMMLEGVEFKVCRNTLKSRHLAEDDMTLGVNFVDAGMVEITRLQLEEGYAYIKP